MSTPRRAWGDEIGAALVEYALLAGLVAGSAVAAARGLGPLVSTMFQSGAEAFPSGPAAGPAPAGAPPPTLPPGPAPGIR